MNMIPYGFFKVQISHSGRVQRRSLIPVRREVCYSSLTSALTARLDIAVTMFVVGKIDDDAFDCPRPGVLPSKAPLVKAASQVSI